MLFKYIYHFGKDFYLLCSDMTKFVCMVLTLGGRSMGSSTPADPVHMGI